MKKIVCLPMITMMVLYNIWCLIFASEIVFAEEISNQVMEMSENDMKKFSNEEMIESEKEFESLVIELPNETVEWSVDHERNIGCLENSYSLMARSSSSIYYDNHTDESLVGNMDKVMNKVFSNGSIGYTFLSKLKSTFVLPGMLQTAVCEKTCDDMTPQGILYYDGYIFITAYCSESEHNSVIYVLNASNKDYKVTLVTGNKSHMSGIEYADGYLWVCETKNGTGRMVCFNYSDIKNCIRYTNYHANVGSIDISGFAEKELSLASGDAASFIVQYNGYLAVGEFDKNIIDSLVDCDLNFYVPSDLLKGNVEPYYTIELPEKSQGISIYRANSNTYLAVNTSYGRTSNSKVYVYKQAGVSYSSPKLLLTHTKTITMPCMLEESIIYGDYTYFVFESCANQYRGNATYVIGKVCGFSNSFIYK